MKRTDLEVGVKGLRPYLIGQFKGGDDGLNRADLLLREQDQCIVVFHFST